MITFWLIVIVMLALSVMLLARPLLRQTELRQDNRQRQNIHIAKERLQELEQEFQAGQIIESDYAQLRNEIEQGLLADIESVSSTPASAPAASASQRLGWSGWVLLGSIPLVSIGLYLVLGSPEMIDPSTPTFAEADATNPHAANNQALGSVEQMVANLAKRLEQEPQNADGWLLLGRSYMTMNRFAEAANALEKAHQLLGDQPGLLLRYADALAMSRNGKISGKPFELVQKALQLRPNDPTGLWLAGLGYEEQGQYQQAIQAWQKLLPLLQDQESHQKVAGLISKAEARLGKDRVEVSEQPAAVAPVIQVRVELASELTAGLSPDATVFVFARAEQGPPMPLAVVRKQVRDLPFTVALDDSLAMTESLRLSQFKSVQVVARVALSGNAVAQSGDLQSAQQVASPGQADVVTLLIKQRLP